MIPIACICSRYVCYQSLLSHRFIPHSLNAPLRLVTDHFVASGNIGCNHGVHLKFGHGEGGVTEATSQITPGGPVSSQRLRVTS